MYMQPVFAACRFLCPFMGIHVLWPSVVTTTSYFHCSIAGNASKLIERFWVLDKSCQTQT